MLLDGKVAAITGASRGIGRAVAAIFAREGADIVGIARNPGMGSARRPGQRCGFWNSTDRLGEDKPSQGPAGPGGGTKEDSDAAAWRA